VPHLMCRFIIYAGHPVLLADVVLSPEHSMIELGVQVGQRLPCIDTSHPYCGKRNAVINADGYGIGFYNDHKVPGLFREMTAVGNSPNLSTLARVITTPLIFAHVRAATSATSVTIQNCHPFNVGRWLFMHNGTISHFKKVQQRIISSLHVDVFSLCEGTSDSWYLFLIFLQKLYELKNSTDFLTMEVSVEEMGWAVKQVLETIHEIMLEAGITDPSSLNFAVTDGNNVVVTRYRNGAHSDPPSLYFALCKKYEMKQCPLQRKKQQLELSKCERGSENTVALVVSEPLSTSDEWTLVPKNSVLIIQKSKDGLIKLSRELLDVQLSPFIDPLIPKLQRTYEKFLRTYTPHSFENLIQFLLEFPGMQIYRVLCVISEMRLRIKNENCLAREDIFTILTALVRNLNLNLECEQLNNFKLEEAYTSSTSPTILPTRRSSDKISCTKSSFSSPSPPLFDLLASGENCPATSQI